MNTKKLFLAIILAVAVGGYTSVSIAASGGEGSNTGCNGQGNPNSPCSGGQGGDGGNGGQGGEGGEGGQGGNSNVHNINHNSNHNTNTNVNQNVNENSNRQHQSQSQRQSQSSYNKNTNTAVADASSTSSASNGDNTQSISNVGNDQGDNVKVYASAPAVFAPGLAVSAETCFGSTSAGASGGNGIFGFGVSFGTTWKSDDCELRMFARSLQQLGQTQAAIALLSQNEKVANALKAAGVPIPGVKAEVEIPIAPVQTSTTELKTFASNPSASE
jgi:hypothetical protein